MSAVDTVALVVGIFFIMGIGVGVLAVMAMAARRIHDSRPYWTDEPERDRPAPHQPHWPDGGYRNLIP